MTAPPARVAHLSRRYRFAASHRLHVEALGAKGNHALFGKCNNPFGHGHNYTVQVTVAGIVDPHSGMVVNLGDLDGFAQRELLERFDHSNLNEDESFQDQVPSTENLCFAIWDLFADFAAEHWGLTLKQVRIEETGNNAFDYFGMGDPVPSVM